MFPGARYLWIDRPVKNQVPFVERIFRADKWNASGPVGLEEFTNIGFVRRHGNDLRGVWANHTFRVIRGSFSSELCKTGDVTSEPSVLKRTTPINSRDYAPRDDVSFHSRITGRVNCARNRARSSLPD